MQCKESLALNKINNKIKYKYTSMYVYICIYVLKRFVFTFKLFSLTYISLFMSLGESLYVNLS